MFGIFKSFGKKYFLGIDFGTSSIKVIELSIKSNKPYLENYGWANFDLALPENETKKMTRYELMAVSLKKVIEKIKPVSSSAFISIPAYAGLITIFELPYMEKSELEQAIKFEAHKYIPASEEEVTVSWDIVDSPEGKLEEGKIRKVKILLAAAMKNEIVNFEKVMNQAKLGIRAVELETFSIVRSLVGNDSGNFLIVDIGYRTSNIILVEKGIIKINRNIDAGGNDITKSISESYNVSMEKAESIKKQEKDLINDKESGVIIYALELIADEIRRIIGSLQSDILGKRKIDGIILSGGSAKLKGLTEYLSNVAGIEARIGDPWQKIVIDEKIKGKIGIIGPLFSVAAGLALRGIEGHKN